jgi:tetratricopeptide (TPR) repeat protein
MSPRPVIFVSAVSKELRSARQLVANTLTFLGYEAEWQDIFGTEHGDLRAMLRRRIDGSKGVVQLIGECYGAEPPTPDEKIGRVSYTQYEAIYAISRGKKVWYLFLDEGFATDRHEKEPEEQRKLQSDYRARIKAESDVYHPLTSTEALEASVLKLRDDLRWIRRGLRRWAAAVATLLLLIVGLSVWLLQNQQHANEQQKQTNEHLQSLEAKFEKLQQGVNVFAEVQDNLRQHQPGQKPDELEQRTYEELGKKLGLDPALLKEELPRFAQQLKKAPNATTYERANAAYVDKDYNEAERLALVAADEARDANPPNKPQAIKALVLAGLAADSRVEYADELKRLRAAATLTDRSRDGLEWAGVQAQIGYALFNEGQFREAEPILRDALKEREAALGPENPDTSAVLEHLADVLYREGKDAEAETTYRKLVALQEKVDGPDHPRTVVARINLAAVLDDEGKYAEAETEDRTLIKIEEKLLGPNAPNTLGLRTNLANALDSQGKYAESEAENRAVIKLEENALGQRDPETLNTRIDLGNVLVHEGRYVEAETEYRAVIDLDEQVLGPEHFFTLETRTGLGEALYHEGKYADAEREYLSVLKLQEKVMGPEHPDTLLTRSDLAEVFYRQNKYSEAETEFREVLKLRDKVLGPDNPNTLNTCFGLALCLRAENQIPEASALAQRAAEGARKLLGPEHPDTKKYEKLQQELIAKTD